MDDAGQGARLSSSASSSIVPAHADDDKRTSLASLSLFLSRVSKMAVC